MESLETFVEDIVREGKKEIDDLKELQRILDALNTKDKLIYLQHDYIVNT